MRAARIINKIPKTVKDENVLKSVNWKDLAYIYKQRLICFSHKAYYNQCPGSIANLLVKKQSHRNMRDNMQVHLLRPNSSIGRTTFKFWNALQETLKSNERYESFKKSLSKNSRLLESVTFDYKGIYC